MAFLRFLVDNRLFLLAGVLLSFISSFGQTYFISIFAGEIREEFALSHGQWGGIYTAGTAVSALSMLSAGSLTDRFRVRHIALGVMAALALACLLMAAVTGPLMLTVLIFALRFTGQGMMSQLSVVAMARWFVATRGKALAVAAMGFAVGQAILPVAFASLMLWTSWRTLWVVSSVIVLLAIPAVLLLLRQERSPRSHTDKSANFGMGARHWSRTEMLRHPLFWFLVPLLLGPPAWGTALFFQQVHLTEVKGWSLVDYVTLIPLYTITSIGSTFASGWAIDRFGAGPVISWYMLPFSAAFMLIGMASSLQGAGLGLMVLGIGTGVQATLPGAFWAEYYGTKHLGGIKAVSSAVMVLGTAIGPGVSGVLIDFGFDFPHQMLIYSVYFLFAGALAILGLSQVRAMITSS